MRDEMEFSNEQRGIATASSSATTIVLDDDVRGWFGERIDPAALGALVNATLREHIKHSAEPLERTLRRVVREELRKAG
ncbi:MAG: CopG family transcriptional regulator [Pseudomonadota bacterium]|nr:CopG family transcriptional regulator [Pseudomonadota bacterium]